LAANGARYLLLGKGGAILLGFPDTTQDADVFVEKSRENGRALLAALKALGFELTGTQQEEILRGKAEPTRIPRTRGASAVLAE
jgi:hypothetical protein